MNLLIIEDEAKISRLLEMELIHEGFTVELAADGRTGLDKAKSGIWDLIVLDLMLPGMDGMEVLRTIRRWDDFTPVILLTARNSTPDKIAGLNDGASDYVVKPFEIEELTARIRACIRDRRPAKTEQSLLSLGPLTMNLSTREVSREGIPIELTPKEYELLHYLMLNQGLALTREQILDQVWGYDFEGDSNVVDVYIRYLRIKIDYAFKTPVIQTVRGTGYSLRIARN